MRTITLLIALACVLTLPALAGSEADNIEACKVFYAEVVNKGDLAMIDELCTPDFIEHEVIPGFSPGLAGVKEFFSMARKAFPDFAIDVEFMLADGDRVAAYGKMSGTHEGEFMGMPPTGKSFEISVIDIVRFDEDGKATEHWGVSDAMSMMTQLGAIGAHDEHAGHDHDSHAGHGH